MRKGSGREELTQRRRDAEGLKDDFAQKDKKETKGRLECGRKVNIENHENRFADRNALGVRMGGDNLTPSVPFSADAGREGGGCQAPVARRW